MERRLEKEKIYLILILVLASALRIFHLDHFGLWFDEAISWHIAQLPFTKIIELAKIDNTPPVYHFILKTWLQIISFDTDFAVKIPTMIFGILSVYMTYKLAKMLFNNKIGLYSAFFGSISFIWIHYSQENRCYSLQVLLTIISLYYFLKALRSNKLHHWIIWTIAGILLFYNHLFAVFVFLIEWIYFIIRWKSSRAKIKGWLISNVILGGAIAFWIPIIIKQMSVIQDEFWIPPPSLNEVIIVFIKFMGGTHFQGKFILTALLHIPSIVLIILAFIAYFKYENKQKLILPILIFVPIIIVYIYSIGRNSLFFYRYLIIVTPAVPIILALGLNYIQNRLVKYICLAVFLIVTTIFLHGYYTNSDYSNDVRTFMRDVVKVMDKKCRTGGVIIHQGEVFHGIQTYFVSKRYNGDKYREFIWRKRKIPLHRGIQYLPPENQINDLERIRGEERIWVVCRKVGRDYNEDGLPTFIPDDMEPGNPSKDIWEELKKYDFVLKYVDRFDKLILCEFVKSEGE